MYVAIDDWLAIVESEYLRSFIPGGGAAVKFAITTPPIDAGHIREGLASLAERHNLAFFTVDGAATRIHMIDQLFHHVARQLDWDMQAGNLMRRLLSADGYVLPEESAQCNYPHVAALNGSSETELRRRVRALLREHVEHDFAMVQEFRIAMLRLCQGYLEVSKAELPEINNIHDWLRGDLRTISVLKPAGIFQKIGRSLARDMFLSLAHWLRITGRQGSMLVLDISRYAVEKRHAEPDGLLFHSTTAVMDAYEVLRQFIDATDDLEGCFITAIAPTIFLTDDKRGLAKYVALKLRIWDEVRDRKRANPLSSLVRLSDAVA